MKRMLSPRPLQAIVMLGAIKLLPIFLPDLLGLWINQRLPKFNVGDDLVL